MAVATGCRASPPRMIPSDVIASPKAMYSAIMFCISSGVALAMALSPP